MTAPATRYDLRRRLDAGVAEQTTQKQTSSNLEGALMDGYGEVLLLEAQRQRARRRLAERLARVKDDPTAADGALAICEEIAELTAQIFELRALLKEARRRSQTRAA